MFYGSWEEDVDSTLCISETIARICQIFIEDKLDVFPIMLSGNALICYLFNVQDFLMYDEATTAL